MREAVLTLKCIESACKGRRGLAARGLLHYSPLTPLHVGRRPSEGRNLLSAAEEPKWSEEEFEEEE